MVYWSGWQTGHHTSVQWYSSCHDNFNQPWTYIPGWLISSVSLAVSVLLRLASLSTDGTSSSIRLLCHASILSALVYSQGRNQSKTKPGFPADSRKKINWPNFQSKFRHHRRHIVLFNAQSLPGILFCVVIVTEDPPSWLHAILPAV